MRSPGFAAPVLNTIPSYLLDFSLKDNGNELGHIGMESALKRLRDVSDRMGARLIVTAAPPWALENGKNRESLQKVVGISDEQYVHFSKLWLQHFEYLRHLSEKFGAIYLDPTGALDDLSYRQYAARPNDWHFSSEANSYVATHIARNLLIH